LFKNGEFPTFDPKEYLRVMVSHNMDSGSGLSGGPVYAGNAALAKKLGSAG
jgi:hypothetical protein